MEMLITDNDLIKRQIFDKKYRVHIGDKKAPPSQTPNTNLFHRIASHLFNDFVFVEYLHNVIYATKDISRFLLLLTVIDKGVGSLTKCSINDSECHIKLYQSVIADLGKTGAKELGIPPIDPLELKNVSVSVLGLLDISLVDGVVKGIKDCLINNFTTDMPNGHLYVDMTCDITVKGRYKAFSSSPLIKTLLGGDFIRGDGVGKVRVEKLHITLDFSTFAYKDVDGEIHLSSIKDKTKLDFEILGKLIFAANNIFMGKEDISGLVVSILNESGKSLAPVFGRVFTQKSLEYLYIYGGRFFEGVPARHYIKEDLTPYLKI